MSDMLDAEQLHIAAIALMASTKVAVAPSAMPPYDPLPGDGRISEVNSRP
jgi:hypothetical protein